MNEQTLLQILSEVKDIKSDLSGIQHGISEMKVELSQIKQAVLETNERVKQMEVVQDEHHRIVELLSSRSIAQEAALKRTI